MNFKKSKEILASVKILIKWVLAISIFFFTACSYDTEDEIFRDVDCNTEMLSYLQDVLPILEANCLECHSSSVAEAGVILEGYTNLKFWVDMGRVQGSIKQESGFSPMPPLGMELNNCEIEKIISWIDQGALEN